MRLAALRSEKSGEIDRLLSDTAGWLLRTGRAPVGIVREFNGRAASHACDMDLRVLPAGPRIAITQQLGVGSRGCRLDPEAIEHAVVEVEKRLYGPADIFLLNKFGQHEAEGHGFRDTIARALDRGLPVLMGIGRFNIEAFDAFAGGMAEYLSPKPEAIRAWCREAMEAAAA
ncbi:DUF2478 domain-containing protein [Rhodovulum adriaticum]|uniref:Uncharacterized protein DUF2478 n=1 Tax=Rhodovulum adriaticum TaxID=35804 RepID=A0A4R2P163_RHOAD|nr:DUF2478 domain-containing protein [Rhodovulum adriaticum]MBK1634823.1 hypothetical protein [Rhodovulum adriaticum]TCP27601.1 uncharacterized protein DUF2478 [Rhodovulum adriaticum]